MRNRKKKPERIKRRVHRRHKRISESEVRIESLKDHVDFNYVFGSYLGLQAFRVKRGPDELIFMPIHGKVYMNDKLIQDKGFSKGLHFFLVMITRNFPQKVAQNA